jgi:hypothetical protein
MRYALLLVLCAGVAHADEVDAKIRALAEPDVLVGIWFGGASGPPAYELDSTRSLPAASVVKTAILVELFASRAAALDQPLGPPLDAILADDRHPALAPFSPKDRGQVRGAFAGASARLIGRIMMASQAASNTVYNGAANMAIALLGGPAAVTEKIAARWSPGIRVARYMLASRTTAAGDNEATPASLAAVLRGIATGKISAIDGPTAAAIEDALAVEHLEHPAGLHRFKLGTLDSDPMTAVHTGYIKGRSFEPVVYVVALALPMPPSAAAPTRTIGWSGWRAACSASSSTRSRSPASQLRAPGGSRV